MVIGRVRGRPANEDGANNSTRRDPSLFEVVDATQSHGTRNSQQLGNNDSSVPTDPPNSHRAIHVSNSEPGRKRGRPRGSKDKNPRAGKRGKNWERPAASEAINSLLAQLAPQNQPMTAEAYRENDEAMAAEDAREADRLIAEANESRTCPSCWMVISKEYQRDFLGKTTRQGTENCNRHRLAASQKARKDRGYPDIR